MMLWACPRAVARFSQMLFPALLFSLERVVGGMKVIISREGVGEDGVPKMDERAVVLPFPSFNLRFFKSEVSWDKGSFFIPFTHAYLSLLYLVANSANKRSGRRMSFLFLSFLFFFFFFFLKKKKEKRKGIQAKYTFLFPEDLL